MIETKAIEADNKVVHPKDDLGKDSICKCCEDHKITKMAMIRGSGYELRNILPKWFSGLGAKDIISHDQSESEGNVTIIIFYR